jgi:hypothetical protein
MIDWKAVARAQGLPLNDDEAERTLGPLRHLDSLLIRIAEQVVAETDPAITFEAEEAGS